VQHQHEHAAGIGRYAEEKEPARELGPERDEQPPGRRMVIPVGIWRHLPLRQYRPGLRHVYPLVVLIIRKTEHIEGMSQAGDKQQKSEKEQLPPLAQGFNGPGDRLFDSQSHIFFSKYYFP
jgi:hypothetical protein